MTETQEIVENQEEFDYDSIVLRRADPDDCDDIINLVEIGEDDIYNRVYSYPKILKLIETAYLAITAIDRDGNVVAFAAFEDYPQGMRGMHDDKHFNYWEDWFKKAYNVEEFSAFNTLWLTYFIAGGSLGQQNQHFAFKQVLQTVYTSIPDLIGILFLARGDADQDDIAHCFGPLSMFFEALQLQNQQVMTGIRGIHRDSQCFFSSRVHVLPFIEIRLANQEDHDDLADVFNSQSETVTEAYGEYFIAELIAAQNEDNRALVAQVRDKAVGLMGLTKEVDVKLLHKCFELDAFDNLLKPEYMDAIRARRALIEAQNQRKADNEEIARKLKLKQETLKCNIIAQRMLLQEHLISNADRILKDIDDMLINEEEAKKLNKQIVSETIFGRWLDNFQIQNPTDYFLEQEEIDTELESNILEPIEFMMNTLEYFGLPKDYINGNGHFPNWDKQKDDAKNARGKKGKKQSKQQSKVMKQLKEKKGKQVEDAKRPTHFDLQPIQKVLKSFFASNCESRSQLRTLFVNNADLVRSVFKDQHGEESFKRCVDINEMAAQLNGAALNLEQHQVEHLGAVLLCFGTIDHDRTWGERVPPETDEQRKAKLLLEMRRADQAKAELAAKQAKKIDKQMTTEEIEKQRKEEEADKKYEEDLIKKMKPSKPQKVMLNLTSIHDLLNSLDKMSEFDRMLTDSKMNSFDGGETSQNWTYDEEDKALERAGRPFVRELVPLPDIEEHQEYSTNPEIQAICEQINDLTTIPDPPESAKNAFAITLFCMEAAFDSRSKDFLKYAFDLFPDRDYLIVTQPHTVPENALLSKFTLVQKQLANTFSHVLYLIHRDYLLEQDITITRTVASDFDSITELLESTPTAKDKTPSSIMEQIRDATHSADTKWLAYSARVEDSVVATFVISKDVNLEYYKSHFHIQDQILMAEHERKGHARLVFSIINPIFEKSTRYMLKELLRLSGKTCLYFEIQSMTVIPTIFSELVHIRSRRFPHFLDRKWDHERYDAEKEEDPDEDAPTPQDGGTRDPLDEEEPPFALCFSTKRLLSEPKILKNSRIVVVGASDTGISFVEALLSISYLNFSNITLISPGGLPHHHIPKKASNCKAYSTSYTSEELRKLMLESRVQVVDSRMTDIDRSDKNVILHDGRVIPYDTLVLAMGIQDKTLNSLKYASQGISPVPSDVKKASGVLSIDDPYLYKYLHADAPLMQALTDRRRTNHCVVYGRTLHAYCLIQGLIHRGVQPKNITMAIPRYNTHVNEEEDPLMEEDLPVIYPDAFEDEHIEEKIQQMLTEKGVNIVKETKLIQIITDKEKDKPEKGAAGQPGGLGMNSVDTEPEEGNLNANLERVLFKKLDIPDEEEEEDEVDMEDKSSQNDKSEMGGMTGGGEDSNMEGEDKSNMDAEQADLAKKKKRKKNELEIECRVLISCGHRDVDQDVFKSIHDNGLVYNGRLIVDRNFQTTDPSIFAAGSLCEFSNRYKSLSQGRSLRMDRYNGREMGSRLARSVFDIHDPHQAGQIDQSQQDEELPLFFLPQGQGGVLPNNIIYYHIKTTNPLILKPGEQELKNRGDLVCDNLDCSTGKGHFIKFTFNNIGLIDSVTYMGHEEIILQSLWSFVGLHENYLNQLTDRYDNGIIPNAVEFLSENWAIALYHEWFGDFCLRMRQGIQGLADVQAIIGQAFDKTNKERKGLSRDQIKQLSHQLDGKTVKMIEDETLEFIKTNMNHLPMYYIPGQEFK